MNARSQVDYLDAEVGRRIRALKPPAGFTCNTCGAKGAGR